MEPHATCAQILLITETTRQTTMVGRQSFYRLLQEAATGQIPMNSFDGEVFLPLPL